MNIPVICDNAMLSGCYGGVSSLSPSTITSNSFPWTARVGNIMTEDPVKRVHQAMILQTTVGPHRCFRVFGGIEFKV